MNKLRKIGVSALAGALVSFSATAAEWNISGQAGITMSNTDEGNSASAFSQDDTITISASGQTENGINVSATFKLEDGQTYDEHNVSFGTDSLGTITFHGHGGSVVMGQMDDITPKAYEEVWDAIDGTTSTATDASTARINGVGEEDNIFTYQSPSIQGLTFRAAYATAATGASASIGNDTANSYSDYMDWGVSFAPEMVDGLTVYYAQGTRDTNVSATTESDESTIGLTYVYGPVTVGYQESEEDKSGVATDNELEQYSIAYAVTDDLTVSYGEREYDHDTSATGNGKETQKESGVGISYTMGGVSIGGSFNSADNVGGSTATTADVDSYEINLSFAF